MDRSYEAQGWFLQDGWHPDPAPCLTQPAVAGRGRQTPCWTWSIKRVLRVVGSETLAYQSRFETQLICVVSLCGVDILPMWARRFPQVRIRLGGGTPVSPGKHVFCTERDGHGVVA